MLILRWGRAEYETAPLSGLPEGCSVVEASGEAAPLEDADVVVVPSVTRVTAAHVPRLRRCRLVLTTTSGFDHVDTVALRDAGVVTARLPLARREAVVHSALGMALALTRRLPRFQDAARADRWDRDRLHVYGATLLGTVGVVGVGVIGSRMVDVLRALGADVLPCDPALPGSVPLDRVLAASDVVTLHCALTPENAGMIGPDALARMRPGAVLVNTARGKLVDVPAAVAAVRGGHLAGLGLDVFPKEPAPLADLVHPDILLTPHAAGWHPGLGDDIATGVATAVRALLAGEPVPYAL